MEENAKNKMAIKTKDEKASDLLNALIQVLPELATNIIEWGIIWERAIREQKLNVDLILGSIVKEPNEYFRLRSLQLMIRIWKYGDLLQQVHDILYEDKKSDTKGMN